MLKHHYYPMSLKLIPAILALSLYSLGVLAADNPSPSPVTTQASSPLDDVSRFSDPYDIEIIVFELETQTDERWPADPGQPPIDQAVGNLSVPGQSGPGVEILPARDDKLDALVYALKRHGAIIHAHVRWRQDLPAPGHASWYQIGDQGMGGVVRVSHGRFIHFKADLLLQRPGQPDVRLHLKARMRSGELHYLDHPLGGILVEADRVEPKHPVEPVEPQQPAPLPTSIPAPAPPPASPRGSMPRSTPDNS